MRIEEPYRTGRICMSYCLVDPAFHFDVWNPITHFFPDFDPTMLQNDSLRLPHFHFGAVPDPAFHFDADSGQDPAS